MGVITSPEVLGQNMGPNVPAWREVLVLFMPGKWPPLSHLALKAQLKFHLSRNSITVTTSATSPCSWEALLLWTSWGSPYLHHSSVLCHILILSQYTGKSRKKCVLHILLPSYSQYIDSNGRPSISRWWCCCCHWECPGFLKYEFKRRLSLEGKLWQTETAY